MCRRDTENTTCWQPFVFELKNKKNLKGFNHKARYTFVSPYINPIFKTSSTHAIHSWSSSGIPRKAKESHMVEQHITIDCFKD